MTPRDPIHVIRPLPTAPVVAILMGFWTLVLGPFVILFWWVS